MTVLKIFKLFIILSAFFYFSLISKIHASEYCKSEDTIEILDTKFERLYFEEANYKESYICSEVGASLNDSYYQGWLAYFYYYGQGTEVDLESAYKYFKIASDRGSGYASWYMGFIYSHGITEMDLKIDDKSSFEYYEKSYDQNYSDSRISLAQYYYFGIGTEINYNKSFELLSAFESTLDDFGKNLLAKHYLLGRGTKQDIEKGVTLLEETIDYIVSEETLNILYGKNFLDKKNRTIKSTFFYQYKREQYINYGYKGLENASEMNKLNRKKEYFKLIKFSKEIIDKFINSSNPITEEVCYATNQLIFADSSLDESLFTDEEKYNYVELAYKNKCGGVAGTNLAYSYLYNEEYKNYQKALEILINEVKNKGGSSPVALIADIYREGYGVDKNPYIAYILHAYRAENTYETLSGSDFDQIEADELKKSLSLTELKEADIALAEINKDYTEIFKYIYGNTSSTSNEKLIVKKLENNNSNRSQISDFQKDIIEKKSKIEKKISSKVDDDSPPQIIIDKDIKIEGLVANINLTVKDKSNIAALYIDGVPIIIDSDNGGMIVVEQTVFVGSDNKEVVIEAYDKWGLNTIENILLNKVVESLDIYYGDYYALIIGNNDYDYLPKLKTAINDANKISSILSSNYNFKEVIFLENATRKEILVAMYDLRKKLSFKDNLFIYYAGHGEIDRQINEGYWQPVDALPELPTEWIDNNTITSIIASMKAKHVLIIADSCYSGLLTRSGNTVLQNTFGNREILLQRLTNKKSRLVFTSGGKEPVQDGGGGNHSIFAKSLINVLEKNIKEITLTEIAQEVIPYVITNSDQTPEFAPIHKSGHDGGDFIFVPKN